MFSLYPGSAQRRQALTSFAPPELGVHPEEIVSLYLAIGETYSYKQQHHSHAYAWAPSFLSTFHLYHSLQMNKTVRRISAQPPQVNRRQCVV